MTPVWLYRLKRALRDRIRPAPTLPDQFTPAGGPVLVLAPHPDDEIIGCGGTLRRHVMAQEAVRVVYLADGGGSRGFPWLTPEQKVQTRREEARRGCEILGITDLVFLNGPDGRLGETGIFNDLAGKLTDLARTFAPRRIYVPHATDAHTDHQAAWRLCQAVNTTGIPVWQYEVWNTMQPQWAVDITAQMPLKRRAIRQHRLALDAFDYVSTMTALAVYRCGTLLQRRGYAEAFRRD